MKKHSLSSELPNGFGTQFKVVEHLPNVQSEFIVVDSQKTIGRYEILISPLKDGSFVVSVINFKYAIRGNNAFSMMHSLIEKGMNPVDAKEVMTILAQGYNLK